LGHLLTDALEVARDARQLAMNLLAAGGDALHGRGSRAIHRHRDLLGLGAERVRDV
jgi:hypothetical protein